MTRPAFALRRGARGFAVQLLQQALNQYAAARSIPERLAEDGILGPATLRRAAQAIGRASVTELDGGDLALCGLRVSLFADLSGHNEGGTKGLVDIPRLALVTDGAVLKLTEGTTYVNGEAARQAREAARIGYPVGGYHFADPSVDRRGLTLAAIADDATAEAEHYLEARAATFARDPFVDALDLERKLGRRIAGKLLALVGGTSAKRAELLAAWCLFWLAAVEKATGRLPWLYLPRWVFDAYLRRAPRELLERLARYPGWLASYNGGTEPLRRLPPPFPAPRAWQFTATARLPGVDGDVDCSWGFELIAPAALSRAA